MNRFVRHFERDRRSVPRHILKTPLRVRPRNSDSPEERTESENVSEKGVFFALNTPLKKGDMVQVLLKMPESVTGSATTEWHCTGHVVRTELRGKRTGVGVQFDSYEVSNFAEPQLRPQAASQQFGQAPLETPTRPRKAHPHF
jgi:PilZ domain